jgi:hypothetical protein
MKEFIEKLIAKLEEIPTKNKCSECPHKQKCDEIEAMDKDEQIDLCGATIKALAIDAVKEIAEEYKNTNIITDFLQYARDNADNYDTNEGWSLADLIDLSIKYSEEYINTSTDTSSDTSTTNADRIRSMTDEELAEFLYDTNHYFENGEYLVRFGGKIVQDEEINILDWLKSEVEGATENE